jgi:Zn-dependent protease with chaperone function
MSSPAISIPPRRSLALFAALAMLMVVVSYIFIVLLAVACVYLPWLIIVNVPSLQSFALLTAGVIVAGSMLWSLVPRRDKFVAPGLRLERERHPRLFAELDEIASALREPLPLEVYLIGDANAWVADRGGLMGFGSRRVMGLGLPLLAALNVSQFRAILAHEFAHYYGGDTELGPWLHRTQMAMIRTFQNMGAVGQTMPVALMKILYLVVFGILKAYWRLFLRAINFVSRRQEFRADELACLVAGPEALISGLRGVHGAALAWPAFLRTELAPMVDMGCLPPVANGFSQFLGAPDIVQQVLKGIDQRLREEKGEPYDSHPPLRERVAAAERLSIPSPPRETESALALLENLGEEELRFLASMHPELMQKALKPVAWEEKGPSVLVPYWTNVVREYSRFLDGITVGNLIESLGRLPQIAPYIRDPKGMLLTPEQRIQRARSLLGMAFALALVNTGWNLHARPGEFHLERGDEPVNPFALIEQLSHGNISKDAWAERVCKLGIEDLPLAPVAATTREAVS